MPTYLVQSLLLVAATLSGSLAVGQDFARGEARSAMCVACHGPRGISANPTFPHLAGQHAAYLETQLEHFKSGERRHPLMSPVAESLSARDIRDLAFYFSRIGPLAGEQELPAAGESSARR